MVTKKKPSRVAVPTAWVDVFRFYWPRLHTWQVSFRPHPNTGWQLASSTAVPELVDNDDAETVKLDPVVAADLAGEAWAAAWDHLDGQDCLRCDYKVGVYEMTDGALVLAGETGVGGRLSPEANGIEDAPTDEDETQGKSLVAMLIRERKDMVGEVVRMTRALASVGEKIGDVLEKAGSLIEKAGEGDARRAEADASARSDEAKFGLLGDVGRAYIEKKAPVWRAEAEHKMRSAADEAGATLEQLCRAAAMAVDGPTAMIWESGGFDWQALVAVLHTAGEHPDWEQRVKVVMLQLENKPDVWKAASASCTAAFVRVAKKIGVTLG